MSHAPDRSTLQRYWLFFLLFALAFRGLYVALEISELRLPDTIGVLSVQTGDTKGYLDPIESVLAGGRYEPDYRMPGVGAPYWVFRQFLDVGMSRDAMVIVQWLLSGLCVYLLGLIATRLSGSDRVGLIVYGAYLLSAYASWFDASISSDSFAVSTIILTAFFLQRAVDRSSLRDLVLAGAFFTWLVFLRPVSVALFLPMLVLLWHFGTWPQRWKAIIAVLLPFAIADGLWTYRNWRANHEFSPLTNQGLLPADFTDEIRGHVMAFLQGYGGNYIWWTPGADVRWYGVWKGGGELDDEGRDANPPPDHAIVEGYTRDSLYLISERIRAWSAGGLTPQDSLAEARSINAKLDSYADLYKREAPLNYHLLSRVRMLKNVMWQHGTEGILMRPFHTLPIWMRIFKVMQVVFYVFAYTFGSCAVLLLLWNWRKAPTLLHLWLPIMTAYMILIYPVVLRMCEWRYMVHQFPLALLLGVELGHRLIRGIRAKGISGLRGAAVPSREAGLIS
ncbi:MAG: glycosyltransferase family 39 protein [Flavobacteriales bacterium]|nr:glycosyltransferase family 39 protein [Flavobacteriales bacterium]